MTSHIARTIVVLMASLALVACSDDEPVDTGSSSSSSGATGSSSSASSSGGTSCDSEPDCPGCQACAYDTGGDCKAVADACTANGDCGMLSDCMVMCVGGDDTKFDGCLMQCNTDHPNGESDYAAVLSCVEGACSQSCTF
jgi:hypothetical protein